MKVLARLPPFQLLALKKQAHLGKEQSRVVYQGELTGVTLALELLYARLTPSSISTIEPFRFTSLQTPSFSKVLSDASQN